MFGMFEFMFLVILGYELIDAIMRIFLVFCFAKIFKINVCFDIIRVRIF